MTAFHIGANRPCFIIAEAGVNHNGDPDLARELIDAAVAAGADAVKFQTFRTDELVTEQAEGAEYQQENLGRKTTQREMLRKLELSHDDFRGLATYAESRGILFLSTPFDAQSADFLAELKMPLFKVGSGELTHHAFLRHLARKKRPLILSTGMADLEETQAAVAAVREEGVEPILLHCVSNYPADPRDANLRAMHTLRDSCQVDVGFSDHTPGIHVSLAAVALGACVVEKHFTLSRDLEGPDHKASLEPHELTALVSGIREVESALGDGQKIPAECERAVAVAARRSWVAAGALDEGTVLRKCHLALRRPGTGLPEQALDRLLGRRLRRSLTAGEILQLEDVEVKHES